MPVVTLVVSSNYHNLLRDAAASGSSAKITYFALGTGTTTPSAGDTKLSHEVYRKRVTSVSNGASTGELLVNVYVSASDAVGVDIEEVAAFAGSSASGTANSGVLVGRALWVHNAKTGLESIQLQLDLTV